MKEKPTKELKELLNSLYKLSSDMTMDNFIQILVPLAYIQLGANHDVELNGELLKISSQKSKDDFFGINDSIKRALWNLSSDEIRELVAIALDKNFVGKLASDSSITPSSLSELVYDLLEIKPGDSFYDLGSGDGSTLANIARYSNRDKKKLSKLYGQEINQSLIWLSRLVVAIFASGSTGVTIKCEDATEGNPYKYNKAYVYSPVGQYNTLKSTNFKSLLYPDIELNEAYHEQWIYIDRMLSGLDKYDDDARAVALVFGKTLTQTNENEYLLRLLDDGWIEGIIELPMNVLNNSSTYTYLIVFSRNNTIVRSVWADDVDYKSLTYELSDVLIPRYTIDVKGIYDLYKGRVEGIKSRYVTFDQLKLLNCWWPTSEPLLTSEDKKGEYIPLSQLATVFNSCQYTATDFDEADSVSDYRILSSKEIENYGIKWDETKYVVITNNNLDKSLIQNGDLIITNKSTKYKIVVVTNKPSENVLSIGGNIIVRPIEGKLDPTYLKMFLESKEGQSLLNMASTGSSIIHFSTSMISNMGIPYLEYSKQVKKANKYNDDLKQINECYEKIKELNSEMKSIFISKEED